MAVHHKKRSPLSITGSVYKALLLREALSRLFGKRAALAWLLLEPVVHMAFMVFLFMVMRVSHVGGIDTALWVMAGMLSFFLFRRTASQGAAAVGANLALYTYRQVKPVDTVIVRSVLEGLLMLMTSITVLIAAGLWGVRLQLDAPLTTLFALAGLWLLGLGYGLIVSVVTELVPELGNLINMMLVPLYMFSGVIMPLSAVPYPYQAWLHVNPVLHGVELVRAGISNDYHVDPAVDLKYLHAFAIVLIFFGLALQRRFQQRLVAL